MKRKLTLLLLPLVCALALMGCKGTLAPGGSYAPVDTNGVAVVQPDYEFFLVDSAFDLAYSTVDAAFKFEKDNRLMLWQISPGIKHTMDQIRPQAIMVRNQYAIARKVYMANPVQANLSVLQQILAKIQQLATAAQAAIPPKI